ncbi:MAG: patatin-like phospholipase family protein [Methylococcaceae bacterium]|nr:patatin-like phospholipase family protein [Methylococcaceae bacterium]MCI0667590.1 patatin-like phospholipase family protein [Methylococcaceae bacterium]MCI0733395.1 patatin-like phospholipase family protein [Methylococcaceae bacterium]
MEEHSNGCHESRCVDAVTFQELNVAQRNATHDPGTRALLDAERAYIKKWRASAGRSVDAASLTDHLSGLALSGGGIRSATFALGVLQALAHYDLLKGFDYLSTVSGGGYVGSALTWLLSQKAKDATADNDIAFSTGKQDFPYGTDNPTPDNPDTPRKDRPSQRAMLNFLRSHGYYLAPGSGINIFALIGVILRGTALNLIVWLPVAMLVLIAGFWVPAKLRLSEPWLKTLLDRIPNGYPWDAAFVGYELLLRFGALIVILLLIGIVVYSFITRIQRASKRSSLSADAWYNRRRRAEKWASVLIPLTALLWIVGLLPAATSYLSAMGPLAVVLGIGMHIRGFLTSLGPDKKPSADVIVAIGAALFLYGFLALAFQLGYAVWTIHDPDTRALTLGILTVIPLVTGYWVNLNYISIHRFYRDRLMESFMPDIDKALKNETGSAEGADAAYLCDFMHNPKSPYPLINTNVVLVDSADKTIATRGGDNFILSPCYCGSNATGWCPTDEFMEGGMTLATAMAISGAAVSPNAGVGGEGPTRNRILSLVLTLLNLRLSYWAHNPIKKIPKVFRIPNHFIPGVVYALGSIFRFGGFNENGAFVELSDGGHFENMAVYELIRRKLKLILVSDGGEDADFTFSDFQTTVRRIENDFGVRIRFRDEGPDSVIPYARHTPAYPPDTKFSWQGYMVADIVYPRPDPDPGDANKYRGLLVYIKSTLIKDCNFKIKGYKAQNPAFPHQSTADQFFDEVQFEAYRELGFSITESMIQDNGLNIASRL